MVPVVICFTLGVARCRRAASLSVARSPTRAATRCSRARAGEQLFRKAVFPDPGLDTRPTTHVPDLWNCSRRAERAGRSAYFSPDLDHARAHAATSSDTTSISRPSLCPAPRPGNPDNRADTQTPACAPSCKRGSRWPTEQSRLTAESVPEACPHRL